MTVYQQTAARQIQQILPERTHIGVGVYEADMAQGLHKLKITAPSIDVDFDVTYREGVDLYDLDVRYPNGTAENFQRVYADQIGDLISKYGQMFCPRAIDVEVTVTGW